MNIDEGIILEQALNKGVPCELKLLSYNDAVSLQAKLNRYIRSMKEIYTGRESPFHNLEVLLVKPKTLRFDYQGKLQFSRQDET